MSLTNATGSKSARSGIESSGTPRARSARAKSHAPGSFSCSITIRTSQPRSRSRGSSESRCASEPEMPATFCRWRIVSLLMALNRSEQPVGPVLDRVVARDELAQLGTAPAVERAQPLGEALGIVAIEAQLRRQEIVEDRVRREHRQARRSRLVDDLVGRARTHVVDQDVAAREERRNLAARHRPAELGAHRRAPRLYASKLSSDPCASTCAPASSAARRIVSSPFAGE